MTSPLPCEVTSSTTELLELLLAKAPGVIVRRLRAVRGRVARFALIV